jgi:hypothetical protein
MDLTEDDVHCSVFAPPAMTRGSDALVQVFLHSPEQSDQVAETASEFDELARRRAVRPLNWPVAQGDSVTIELELPGMEVREPVQRIRWPGRPMSVQFLVVAPEDRATDERARVGTVRVHLRDIPIGQLKLMLSVRITDVKDGDEGAWIFLSHSHNDIKEVRRVRDALEAKGHNPLLFFLKCLDDSSEVDDLIRREIEARNFFLLCDSPNAQASRWVQHEVELIKSMKGKVYRSIDLGGPWRRQLDAIDDLTRQATVFLSYSHADRAVADQMALKLRALGYHILELRELPAGAVWKDELHKQIDTALATGSVVFLMSPEAMQSRFVQQEALYAVQRRQAGASNVRPFIIRDPRGVGALLSRPEWAPLADIHWGELLDIQKVSLAELSRMMGN